MIARMLAGPDGLTKARPASPPARRTARAGLLLLGATAALALGAGAQPPSAIAAHLSPPSLTVSWVGDITLGSRYGDPPANGRSLFRGVRSALSDGSVVAGNLEGTLATGGPDKCGGRRSTSCFSFRAPPRNAGALRWAGFDVVNLANNHAYDFGGLGQRQTLHALRAAHVASTGRPGEITVLRHGGQRIAFLGFAPYPWAANLLDVRAAKRLVAQASRRARIVVAFIHAGAEGADQSHTPHGHEHAFGEDRGDTRAVAHALVDAGADLVLGSGPHILRGVECYRRRLIAYSLGNFAAYHNLSTAGTLALSGILRARVAGDGALRGAQVLSLRLDRSGVPGRDRSGAAARLVAARSREDFPHSMCRVTRRGGIVPRWSTGR